MTFSTRAELWRAKIQIHTLGWSPPLYKPHPPRRPFKFKMKKKIIDLSIILPLETGFELHSSKAAAADLEAQSQMQTRRRGTGSAAGTFSQGS